MITRWVIKVENLSINLASNTQIKMVFRIKTKTILNLNDKKQEVFSTF